MKKFTNIKLQMVSEDLETAKKLYIESIKSQINDLQKEIRYISEGSNATEFLVSNIASNLGSTHRNLKKMESKMELASFIQQSESEGE